MMGYRRLSCLCLRAVSLCLMLGLLCGQCVLCMDDSEDEGPTRGDLRSRGADHSCPPGWEALHRACYRFVSQPASSWDDARRDCEQVGAQLLSVGPMAELNQMKKQLKKLDVRKTWWIGLHKNRTSWEWLDGGRFDFRITRWMPGEPNNQGRSEEDCVEMNVRGQINDKECEAFRPYICEKQPAKAKTTTSESVTTTTTTTNRHGTSAPSPAIPTRPGRKDPSSDRTHQTTSTLSALSSSTDDEYPFPEEDNERGGSSNRGDQNGRRNRTSSGGDDDDDNDDKNNKGGKNKGKTGDKNDDDDLFELYAGCYMKEYPNRKKKQPKFLYTVGSNTCPPVLASRTPWPETQHGVLVAQPCRRRKEGNVTFQCGGNPTCWRGEPNVDQCASKAFRKLLKQFSSEDETEALEPEETVAVTSELANVTRGDDVTEEDITVTSKLIRVLAVRGATRKIKDRKKVKNIVANVVRAGSNLVSRNKTRLWRRMARQDKIRSATSLLVAMETATVAMAGELAEPTKIVTRDDNIELELRVVAVSGQGQKEDITYSAEDSDTKFSIPLDTLSHLSSGGLAKMVFMTHYTMGSILDDVTDDVSDDNLVERGDEGDGKASEEAEEENNPSPDLASYVVSASVAGGESSKQLPEPVTFTITHTKKIPSGFESLCSFWSISESGLGAWSQEGCRKVGSNDSHTQCQCDHMTNFAILMSVQKVEISETHKSTLRVVTILGCVISCLCLLASWITFTCFSALQGERNSIHKHLVVCLFIAEVLFLSGIDKTENPVLCGVVAGFLHYFFLATFLWMMMEAVHIILMLVQVFDASRSRMPYYYAAAYGPPLLIVAISAGVYSGGYGTEEYCWLTTERGFIWSFAGPVAVILFVNSVVLIYAMTMVCRHSDYVFSAKDKTSAEGIRSWIQGAMALEVLLGLTWILGFFFLSQQSVAVAYLFTILNSTQGLFIFLFHCLLNKKARKEYRRVLKMARQPSTTGTGSGSGTHSASLARNKLTNGPSFNQHNSSQDTAPTSV